MVGCWPCKAPRLRTRPRTHRGLAALPWALALAVPSLAVGATCNDPVQRAARIVGGSEAHPVDWGWQVSLRTKQSSDRYGGVGHFCGGSLISEGGGRWVVTAAHCLVRELGSDRPGPHFRVMHGSQDVTRGELRAVKSIHVPSAWTGDVRHGADIALLELGGALSISNILLHDARRPGGRGIRQPTLPLQNASLEPRIAREGHCATVTGWGATHEPEGGGIPETPRFLLEVTVPLVSEAVCRRAYPEIRPSMICAGYPEGGRDACQGDSGGPLMVRGGPANWSLVGVVSYGHGCGRPNAYGVYTRVSAFQPWISCVIAGGTDADCWRRFAPRDFDDA